MNQTNMKRMVKKMMLPLVVGGMTWLSGWAQAGDIVNIFATEPNKTWYASGQDVEFTVRLFGQFEMISTGGSDLLNPELRMSLNGGSSGYASLYALSPTQDSEGIWWTDAVFRYTIEPGDMASPLKIAVTGTSPYTFIWHEKAIRRVGTSTNAIWTLDFTHTEMTGDLDNNMSMASQQVILSTLALDDNGSPSVAASESVNWKVTTVNPVESAVVDCYVWTADTNLLQIGTTTGQSAQLIRLATGETEASFSIKGLAIGTATIYLQRAGDYANNGSVGVTNFIKRTISVTAPPAPTVSILFPGDTTSTTLDESSTAGAGSLTVRLSESFSNNVSVLIAVASEGSSNVTNVSQVTILSGETEAEGVFSVPDGTAASLSGVLLTPVIVNNPVASNYFTRIRTATVKVKNVAPVVASASCGSATRDVPCTLSWSISDVPADLPGLTNLWYVNSVLVTNTYGGSGSFSYVFSESGPATISITSLDKDGGISAAYTFNVTVGEPVPLPSLKVSPVVIPYSETNATGELNVTLSKSYAGSDIWVRLESQDATCVAFGTNNAAWTVVRIPQGETTTVVRTKFNILDGSVASGSIGIEVVPSITNVITATYAPVSGYVFIDNMAPVITRPTPTTYSTVTVPMGVPFTIPYDVSDAVADRSSMRVDWTFTSDDNAVVDDPLTATGYKGNVSYVFTRLGGWTVRVTATDKDGAVSAVLVFPVTVVEPPPDPTVSVTPLTVLNEQNNSTAAKLWVMLSEAFTNSVTVRLDVSPVTNAVNGALLLPTLTSTTVVINKGSVSNSVWMNPYDGTALSSEPGFTVHPTVISPADAASKYVLVSDGIVKITNVAPTLLVSPIPATPISENADFILHWSVGDVPTDISTMRVTFDFGDGRAAQVFNGKGSGNVTNVYAGPGTYTVLVSAEDKDGGLTETQFSVTVEESKLVIVTPVGPNFDSTYYGATGLGYGWIRGDGTMRNVDNVYTFLYGPAVQNAYVQAIPYKAGQAITNFTDSAAGVWTTFTKAYDSFFFVWVGDSGSSGSSSSGSSSGQITPTAAFDPANTVTAVGIDLSADAAMASIKAVFSREYLYTDNMGDINMDGIPDKYAIKIESSLGTTSGSLPLGLRNLNAFNDDLDADGATVGDFLPADPTASLGLFDFRPVLSTSGGNQFTAYYEIRGFNPGLNNKQYGSDPDPADPDDPSTYIQTDEPGASPTVTGGTDPTLEDTDHDGYPDGWEYYFWYHAEFDNMTGSAYNPLDTAQGTEISSKDVADEFNPIVPSGTSSSTRDTDKDGLLDIEELVLGTNPINWDTDGDGICDLWEILRALNPRDPADGASALENNPDGDYMAYAFHGRDLITLDDGSSYLATNHAYEVGADVSGQTLYTWYHYGDSNAPVALGRPVKVASGVVTDVVSTNVLFLHFQVLREFGFDPRTAWTDSINNKDHPTRFPAHIAFAANTKAYTSLDEYLLLKFMSENQLNGATASMPSSVVLFTAYTTDPRTPDSDVNKVTGEYDGMPDGWELYVSINPSLDLTVATNRYMRISPWNYLDGDYADNTMDNDKLINRREFAGTDSSAAYTNALIYRATNGLVNLVGYVTLARPAADALWINKFWPTNPWNKDTDGDALADGSENTFIYGLPVDNKTALIAGGGLNPNAMDTDLDGLPDAWESVFAGTASVMTNGTASAGTNTVSAGTNTLAMTGSITNGMDGTFVDYAQDWDHDGLLNYQEYWVQAVRSFRYDLPDEGVNGMFNAGLPMDDTFDPISLFVPVTNAWDISQFPWGPMKPQLYVLLPVGPAGQYISTSPLNPDSDYDGMDDYYEMFHGLNPILGEGIAADGSDDLIARAYIVDGMFTIYWSYNDWTILNGFSMSFVDFPWLAGMPEADPDADGLLNFEEMLLANTAPPACYNTDPTPLWFTDDYFDELYSYGNPDSLTYRFYGVGYSKMFFWPGGAPMAMDLFTGRYNYRMYSYEMNEGYDTDNDGISDKSELVDSVNSLSDPQDQDSPVRRQAMWFGGQDLKSAASTFSTYHFGLWDLRTFTVELWVRPEDVSHDQVLVERSLAYMPSDASTTNNMVVRRNFRIGISADGGRVYGMFQNAGSHDDHTAEVYAYGSALPTNQWTHVALRMDGLNSVLTLFVNGEARTSVATALIPANGVSSIPIDPTYLYTYYAGSVTVGAANDLPANLVYQNIDSYSLFYKGYVDEVRIWDGPRSNDEIRSNYTKRFGKSDLLSNRLTVRTQELLGYSRVSSNPLQLAPELLCHYTFDNLFSADDRNYVATSPRGFTSDAVNANRPSIPDVVWWAYYTMFPSFVYTDTKYVPWIENGVEHLPLFGGVSSTGAILQTNAVMDSVYWSHTMEGVTAGSYSFPNSNNPYEFYYLTSPTPLMATKGINGTDLLPLGYAWAKQVPSMWDEQGASGVWTETGDDSDSDGLPDWWESYVAALFGVDPASISWNALYPDGSGLTYGERYLRDIALGMTASNNPYTNAGGWTTVYADYDGDGTTDQVFSKPTVNNPVVPQTADSDGDGMPDWWESLYNLDPASDVGDDGALGDPDLDGLSNLAEYLISEVYHFHYLNPNKFKTNVDQPVSDYYLKQGSLTLGSMFSDHDFMEDSWEDQYDISAVSRYVYDPLSDADEDGWSNWAESRYRAYSQGTSPELSMKTEVLGLIAYEFPIPTVEATLRYDGAQSGGNLVLQVYSDPDMKGLPDATFTVPNDSTTTTTKSQPLGYWVNGVVSGLLSPGSIQPGTLSITFTDLWTDMTSSTGFDVNGVIYSNNLDGSWDPIGTIDYVTGQFDLDLSYYAGSIITSTANPTNRSDYLEIETSYIQMSYTVQAISGWPKTVYLGRADDGYIREGTNYVFAFLDADSSGTWDAGEPCGMTTPVLMDIGWDYNWANIQLTDYTPGYLRLSLDTALRSEDVISGAAGTGSGTTTGNGTTNPSQETRVRVYRRRVASSSAYQTVVLDKTLKARRYLNDGDWLASGVLALDWGLSGVPTAVDRTSVTYEVYEGSATLATNATLVCSFTNLFDAVRAQAVGTSPMNGQYVYSAQPTFKWTMPDGYVAFAFELRKNSSSGTMVYQTSAVQAPVRDARTGEYIWEAPIHSGSKLPNGQIFQPNSLYAWRVMALNAAFSTTNNAPVWSTWNVFRLAANSAMSAAGYGELRASVKYFGPAASLSGKVRVQAFRTASFTGVPDSQYTLTDAELGILTNAAVSGTNAVLRGLSPSSKVGDYYVRAYIDSNGNNARDPWESWGYANYYGVTETPYTAKPFTVSASKSTDMVKIVIEDADTDQDWFPDIWEYEANPASANFLGLTYPASTWTNSNAEISNPYFQTASAGSTSSETYALLVALAMGGSDLESDGVSDLAELILGTNPESSSTADDGYTDAEKVALGLSPADKLTLNLTGLSMSQISASVAGYFSIQKASLGTSGQTFLEILSGVTATGTYTYAIDYTPSLLNAQWTTVKTGTVTGSGAFEQAIGLSDTQGVVDPEKGFFRVRLISASGN